ncbi:MAG: fatty acid CoA ligase family protein [Planctomycetaceae bacterium]
MESLVQPQSAAVTRTPAADYGNIALRLRESARRTPHQRAVVFPAGRDAAGRATYSHLTFEQLDRESDRLARGLVQMGVTPGMRLVLAVRPGLEFIALTFALFKAGVVIVLIDPGMGRASVIRCLEEVQPHGFVAIPGVHAVRVLMRRRFREARFNVTVGRRWFWGGPNYAELLGGGWTPFEIPDTKATDPAAIIFTSGSTGPPKGVLYEHGMFNAQVDLLRERYGIQPGEIDLPGFPLFALFNAAMSVTTVVPDMDPSKPAQVDPARIVEAIRDQGVTQAFGSPAMWNAVGRYCEERDVTFPSLRRVLSAGAPVPDHVLRRMRKTLSQPVSTVGRPAADGLPIRAAEAPDVHTPYGATESLPVASISGREVLRETAEQTRKGGGTCVGLPFPHVRVKIVAVTDGPIAALNDVAELPLGEIGEVLVQSPSTTHAYFRRPDATAAAKIPDGDSFWHRMGDVGRLDAAGRLWFCGRKAHIVNAAEGRMFSVCCEAIFNEHPDVYRSALVGVGERPQRPAIVAEPEPGRFPSTDAARQQFAQQLREIAAGNPLTASIDTFLFHPSLPVDVRHNTKIKREELSEWAAGQLR